MRELVGTTSAWTVDPRRVFVAGLSAGGAMAAILAATYPDLFAAVAVHSGLAYGSADGVPAPPSRRWRAAARPGCLGRAAHAAMGDSLAPSRASSSTAAPTGRSRPVNGEQVLAQSMAATASRRPSRATWTRAPDATARGRVAGGHAYEHARWTDRRGVLMHERLIVDGMGHAWSGGAPGARYTDPRGPDATEAIWRFFAQVGVAQR